MEREIWLRTLRTELHRRRLPFRYIDRLIDEMRDHADDLIKEDTMSEGTLSTNLSDRIGRPERLADAAKHEHAKNWMGRHPVMMFLFAPIPLTLAAWCAYLAIGGLLFFKILPSLGPAFQLEGTTADTWAPSAVWLTLLFHMGLRFLPPAIVAAAVCRWALRSGRGWRWALAACGCVAIIASLFTSALNLPMQPGAGEFSVGFTAPPSLSQLSQCVVPLLVGGAILWWSRDKWREDDSSMVHVG